MFDDLIINDSFDIIKFLNKLNLDLFYTKPQFKHLVAFVLAMVPKDFNGKVADVNELNSEKHRTTISKFLNKSSWNESLLLEEMKNMLSRVLGNYLKILINRFISLLMILLMRRLCPRQRHKTL